MRIHNSCERNHLLTLQIRARIRRPQGLRVPARRGRRYTTLDRACPFYRSELCGDSPSCLITSRTARVLITIALATPVRKRNRQRASRPPLPYPGAPGRLGSNATLITAAASESYRLGVGAGAGVDSRGRLLPPLLREGRLPPPLPPEGLRERSLLVEGLVN